MNQKSTLQYSHILFPSVPKWSNVSESDFDAVSASRYLQGTAGGSSSLSGWHFGNVSRCHCSSNLGWTEKLIQELSILDLWLLIVDSGVGVTMTNDSGSYKRQKKKRFGYTFLVYVCNDCISLLYLCYTSKNISKLRDYVNGTIVVIELG